MKRAETQTAAVVVPRSEFIRFITAKPGSLDNAFDNVDLMIRKCANILALISGLSLILVMLIAVINIAITKIFHVSIANSTDVIAYLLVPMVYVCLPAIIVSKNSLLSAEVLEKLIPRIVKLIIRVYIFLLGEVVFILMAWRSWVNMTNLFQRGAVNAFVENSFKTWPFAAIMFGGLALGAICFAYQFVREIVYYKRRSAMTGGAGK